MMHCGEGEAQMMSPAPWHSLFPEINHDTPSNWRSSLPGGHHTQESNFTDRSARDEFSFLPVVFGGHGCSPVRLNSRSARTCQSPMSSSSIAMCDQFCPRIAMRVMVPMRTSARLNCGWIPKPACSAKERKSSRPYREKLAESELIQRVTSGRARATVPPVDSGKKLNARDIAVLKKWIEQGAKWQGHWAFIKPVRAAVPPVTDKGFTRNEIDRFILARMEAAGLKHSPEADRVTLIRRLSFDLTGLPPTVEQIDQFVADSRPDAYERLVEQLLDSPHYGERMALYWLDLVRFADTAGYHSDNPRDIVPYRDYVIQAFNSNLPFDRFTVEQLAGDLLPSPTVSQKVASGYNRLLQTTEEGGAQAKEYIIEVRVPTASATCRASGWARQWDAPNATITSSTRLLSATSTAWPHSSPTSRNQPSAGANRGCPCLPPKTSRNWLESTVRSPQRKNVLRKLWFR